MTTKYNEFCPAKNRSYDSTFTKKTIPTFPWQSTATLLYTLQTIFGLYQSEVSIPTYPITIIHYLKEAATENNPPAMIQIQNFHVNELT